jgi:Spy/CpxP family protein refolding chaperone
MTTPSRIVRAGWHALLLIMVAAGPLGAQVPADREALLNGDGDGMAAYAELNGYPAPKDILDLAAKLSLTSRQKQDIRELYNDTRTRARVLGKLIVKVEEELHYAFNSGMLGLESVEEDAESIGKMRGTLRGIHLAAHVKTRELLTKKQLEQYAAFRKEAKGK